MTFYENSIKNIRIIFVKEKTKPGGLCPLGMFLDTYLKGRAHVA